MVSESAVNQLARAWGPLRELRRKDFVSVLRGRIRYGPPLSGDLAKVPVANGYRILDFCLFPDHWNLYRF